MNNKFQIGDLVEYDDDIKGDIGIILKVIVNKKEKGYKIRWFLWYGNKIDECSTCFQHELKKIS